MSYNKRCQVSVEFIVILIVFFIFFLILFVTFSENDARISYSTESARLNIDMQEISLKGVYLKSLGHSTIAAYSLSGNSRLVAADSALLIAQTSIVTQRVPVTFLQSSENKTSGILQNRGGVIYVE